MTLAIAFASLHVGHAHAFQPTLDLIGGIDDLVRVLKDRRLNNLGVFTSLTKNESPFLCDRSGTDCVGYLYSPKWGWIDLRHFFAGAAYTSRWYLPADVVLLRAEILEAEQARNGSTSAWSYEDLPSNMTGAFFAGYYRRSADTDLVRVLTRFFITLGFVDDPRQHAPNLGQLPPSEENEPRPPQNRTYTARYTTAGPDTFNALDRELARLRDRLNRRRSAR